MNHKEPAFDITPVTSGLPEYLALPTVKDLKDMLDHYGVRYKEWEEKTIDDLFTEVAMGDSLISVNNLGTLRRHTAVAWIDIYATGPEGALYKLAEDRQEFTDKVDEAGNPLIRRRTLPASLGEKIIIGGTQPESNVQGAQRGIKEELGVEVTQADLTLRRTGSREEPARSYPGLTTEFTDNYFSVEIPYQPDGFIEEQASKTTYFVWQPYALAV